MSTPVWCTTSEAAEPARPGQLAACIAGSVGHLGWRPLLITGMLRNWLSFHFSAATFIEEPQLQGLLWRKDETTGILIESIYRWRPETMNKRPAILVKRNAYRNVRFLLNDRTGVSGQGDEQFSTSWVGSHTLFCIHGTGASAELLATEVQREITQFAPVFGRKMGLMKFQVTEVGPIALLEEYTDNFLVPITIGWAYQETWQVASESPIFRVLQLDLQAHDC